MTRWALVTGASKGIGESISTIWRGEGGTLLLTARSETLLLDMQQQNCVPEYNVDVEVYPCDLTDRKRTIGFVDVGYRAWSTVGFDQQCRIWIDRKI